MVILYSGSTFLINGAFENLTVYVKSKLHPGGWGEELEDL
jgi:hypothetical protein